MTDNTGVLRLALTCAIVLLARVGLAIAQPTATDADAPAAPLVTRPVNAGRVVKLFDFEERADVTRPDFNPEAVPQNWFRAQADPPERPRPGFPQHNRAAYDLAVAYSGRVSIKLPTAGGSTALRLGARVLPVFAAPDYAVTAMVRTEGLTHARAVLWAQLLDGTGQPVAASARQSEPLQSPGDWSPIGLTIPGGFAAAAFIQVELQLLQPEQLGTVASSKHAVPQQDLSGAAWFDDLRIVQLPRVDLHTQSPTGVFAGDLPATGPLLSAIVSDLSGEELHAAITLADIDGGVIGREERALPAGGGAINWSPPLPRWGWYRATLELRSAAAAVGSTTCDLLWLPESPPRFSRTSSDQTPRRLGLQTEGMLDWEPALVAGVVRAVGAGSVAIPLPAIGDSSTLTARGLAGVRHLVDDLLSDRREVSLALTRLDPALARDQRLDPADVTGLLARREAVWLPSLRGVLDQYGQRVQRWQITLPRGAGELPPGSLAAPLENFRETLQRFVPGPIVRLAWRADWSPPPAGRGAAPALDVLVPGSFPPAALRALTGQWMTGPGAQGLSLQVEPPDAFFGPRAAVTDTFQRVIEIWAAIPPDQPAPRLMLPRPWRRVGNVNAGRLDPDPRLALWRTLADHLARRRVVGTLPTPPGVVAHVLADEAPPGERSGAIVLWNAAADPARARVSAYLGEGPITRIDAFGNRTPVKPADASGLYQLETEPTPAFIEGIDPELVLFWPGLKIEPQFVPAIAAEHRRELVLVNPWPERVTGEVQLVPPPGRAGRNSWRFTPVSPMAFSLGPGQTQRLPFAFSFGAAQESGAVAIHAVVRLNAARSYGPLKVTLPITIGLPDLDLSPSAVLAPNADGPDVVVLASVSNTGDQPRTLQISVQAPGRPVLQQPVSNLAPKESVVRRFVLPGAAASLSGQAIRVSLLDIDGTERLNKTITVP